ncbi:MAG: N-6 DNA methylase [Alphaproteobacteria bacterium]|nr:N-6 DNA methylase [Alphaproteobacteria bacterium]
MSALSVYFREINRVYAGGDATEHSYRRALQTLLEQTPDGVEVTNEPKSRTDCGNPDFVVKRGGVPIGYVEAKDLNKNLDSAQHKEQFARYREGFDNLIVTNHLIFRLYQNGEIVNEVVIGRLRDGKINPVRGNLEGFKELLDGFGGFKGRTIGSPEELAEIMASRTRYLRDIIKKAVRDKSSALYDQLKGFRKVLIHDMDEAQFADLYAQTLAYGLFAARVEGREFSDFDRMKAVDMIPEASPFLRWLFGEVAGHHIDPRIRLGVDNLASLMSGADVFGILEGLRRRTRAEDPLFHFYETFLAKYNPRERERRGVYYTPIPVVNFIARAVDDLLKEEFGLAEGLADKSMVAKTLESDEGGRPVNKKFHRVQVLDPAAGTGTFLAEVIRLIHDRYFQGQQGRWEGYVDKHLLPRLNGFELLMAPYTMAHINMDSILRETGYRRKRGAEGRFRFYLTNALEGPPRDPAELPFALALAQEANQANEIKRDTPVMVVIGNPPYSVESANKGEWIMHLLKDYKQEPGDGKLQERNSKSLNDDYVKFLRYGEHLISRTGEGVLAFINNHSFLDNPTFRGMRWHLLQTFDEIYIVDLHGNTRKKERNSDGSPDVNVFDIQQGVSINLLVKTGRKRNGELARIRRADLYGSRESKYARLEDSDLAHLDFHALEMRSPRYLFKSMDFDAKDEYDKGFSVNDMFRLNATGVNTKRDNLAIHFEEKDALKAASDILSLSREDFYEKYNLPDDVRDWRYEWARKDIESAGVSKNIIRKILYRPMDLRYIVYTGRSRGFIGWPVIQIMRHFLSGENVGLVTSRMTKEQFSILCTDDMTTHKCATVYDRSYTFPLYLYPDESRQLIADNGESEGREPNLNEDLVEIFSAKLGLPYVAEKGSGRSKFAPIDVLDYIYAVLYSPNYREKYQEFLKISFPRVPYPEDKKLFWRLVNLGGQLRDLHLMKSETLNTRVTEYNIPGDNVVEGVKFQETDSENGVGRVWINKKQHFDKVPKRAWEFRLGGYQPCQKWLKDRKGQKLGNDDIQHYQRIVVALDETAKLMRKIAALDL